MTDKIPMIYFDNNATTIMPPEVIKSVNEWCNRGNPSSSYTSAKEAQKMMSDFRDYIGSKCNINIRSDESKNTAGIYQVIFTGGASEANCTALGGIVDAYARARHVIPHVIMGATEHKSLYEMAHSYQECGKAKFTFINPTYSGHIHPDDVEAAILEDTCLICVMHANNETGAISDIKKIGAIAHKHNIPFHCDTVQSFGKFFIDPIANCVDSFTISFHKLGGPPGVGALVIREKLWQGYGIEPMIFGSQNYGLRGGTENIIGIGASYTALRLFAENRDEKNMRVGKIKKYIMSEISKKFPTKSFREYANELQDPTPRLMSGLTVVFLSGDSEYYLPNTILLSVVKPIPEKMASPEDIAREDFLRRGGVQENPKFIKISLQGKSRDKLPLISDNHDKHFCNQELRNKLADKKIVVSVGSACNTSSPKASHVLYSMGADELIRKGAIRISLGDQNTMEEAKIFVESFTEVVQMQISKPRRQILVSGGKK